MKPNKQQKLEFINNCGCVVDYSLLEKAMLWFSRSNLMRKKVIRMHGNYPAISMCDTKMHVHRLIKSFSENRILNINEHVHHLDENKLNSKLDNLKVVCCKKHISEHLKGKKQDRITAIKRTNASCLARYGHSTKEYEKLIHEKESK